MLVAWIRLISLVVAMAIAPAAQETVPGLGVGRTVAPGVLHFTLGDPALLAPPAPISVQLLRLDLTQVDLTTELALGNRQGRATVLSAARRRQAIAAVNAGYFLLNNGDPVGPLRIDGELVSDGTLGRAAAAMVPNGRGGKPVWLFDRASVAIAAVLERGGSIAVDGVDTTRAVGALMLYTPRYGPHSDTAPTGTFCRMKRPSTAVAVLIGVPVTSTIAPASGVPCSPSTTRPTRRPVSCCATSDPGASTSPSTASIRPNHDMRDIRSPEQVTVSGWGICDPPLSTDTNVPGCGIDQSRERQRTGHKSEAPGETGRAAHYRRLRRQLDRRVRFAQ